MPSNPYRDEFKARQQIDVFMQKLKTIKRIDMNELTKQIALAYPVSIKMIESFIKKFYVERGYCNFEDGVLTYVDN